METKLKINFQTRELEVSGDEKFVIDIFNEYKHLFEQNIENEVPYETKKAQNKHSKVSAKKIKGVKRITNSYSIITNLNLKPKDKEHLKDFYGKYDSKNGYQRNLIFVYYLTKILKLNNITVNHVYSCYKDVAVKFPDNLYQNLIDTKNDKGWILTKNMDNLTVTTTGENYLEHTLPKKIDPPENKK
jgi:hypothetical protein